MGNVSADILKEVNALIIEKDKNEYETHENDDKDNVSEEGESEESENKGTLIVDATCVPEDMWFSHDVFWIKRRRKQRRSSTGCRNMPPMSMENREYTENKRVHLGY